MRLFNPFVLLGLGSLVAAFCGTGNPSEEGVAFHREAHEKGDRRLPTKLTRRSPFTVGVYIHHYKTSASEPDLSQSNLNQQMTVLNQGFNVIGLSFQLAGIKSYVAPELAAVGLGSQAEAYIKQQHRGNQQTLNIYIVPQVADGLAGYSTFPWDYPANPQNDGIVMDRKFMPGGAAPQQYNTGKILTHEAGHWTGLLHTFHDGCNGGDLVDDTPAEASSASGCPRSENRDTCPGPGVDPIYNMMDYTDDTCRVGFTGGQYNRLAAVIYQYRGINLY